MTDLDAVRLCAVAMGLKHTAHYDPRTPDPQAPAILVAPVDHPRSYEIWNPLHDDEQAFHLVKRFRLTIMSTLAFTDLPSEWVAELHSHCRAQNADLNRAIVYCVAAMQRAKGE